MESTPTPSGRGRAVRMCAVVAAVLIAVTLAVVKFARPKGPEDAGAAAQTGDGRGPRTGPRDLKGGPTTRELNDAAAARDTLRSYFARIASWKIDRALDLCHTTNGDEQLLATGLAEYGTVQYACREQVRQKFGAAGAKRAFGHVFTTADFKAARAVVTGDRANVLFEDGQHWPMIKVEGRWKLSMFDYAVSQRRTPAALAAAYTEVVKVHMAVGRELRAGKFKTVEAFEQALREGITKASQPASTKPATSPAK